MRRKANSIVHTLRDQVRGVRYSIRAEAQVPGSSSSIAQQALDFPPFAMVGSMFGTPALRLADGLFTQVEHVASDLMHKVEGRAEAPFPCPIADFLPRGNVPERLDFATTVHREVSRMLTQHGARNMLVSEHALDTAWAQVLARHGDRLGLSTAARSPSFDQIVLACASLATEVAKARPIQRMDLIKDAGEGPRHLMLAPNVYCGLVLGLAVAIVSTKPAERTADRAAIMESADSTVDARFDRLKQALDSRTGAQALADEFKGLLPYLP